MISEALRFLINTVFGFLVYAALLRFIMQCLRAPFRNPVGQAVSGLLTRDWVRPQVGGELGPQPGLMREVDDPVGLKVWG